MNAAAATAISSFCFRLFLFNDILSLLWSVPTAANQGNSASEHTFQQMSSMRRWNFQQHDGSRQVHDFSERKILRSGFECRSLRQEI